jgi:hypothetical protein
MLEEIENKLAKVLREKLIEVPKQNIIVGAKPSKPPAVIISNLEFKFEKTRLSENLDQGKIELEEIFNSDGVKASYKLKEKPLKKSVSVESPPKTILAEDDYSINYNEGSIDFRKAPAKGKSTIFVRYNSRKNVMTLKSMTVKTLYSVEVIAEDRSKADFLAEKVVKTLLTAEDQLLGEGIKIEPVGGLTSTYDDEKTAKVMLRYSVEKEIRVEQVVEPMERIEITSKNI